MSKTLSLHHIVFSTKYRQKTIPEQYKRELYAYILGIIRNKKCFVLRMNGIADHIHILVDVNPTISIAELVKDIKQWSSVWLKQNEKFKQFQGWGRGYYAVSLGLEGVDACKNYIINQEQHHLNIELLAEMENMARQYGLAWYEEDWG